MLKKDRRHNRKDVRHYSIYIDCFDGRHSLDGKRVEARSLRMSFDSTHMALKELYCMLLYISEGKTRNNISLPQLEPKTIANIVHQKFHVDNVSIEFQPYIRRQVYELSLLYPYTGDFDDKNIRLEMYYGGNIWDINAEETEERLAITYTSKEHKNHCLIQRVENNGSVSGKIFVKNNADRQTISFQSNDKREPRFWDCKMLKLLYLKELKNWIENVDDVCAKNALEILPHYIDFNQLEQH